MCVTYKDNIVFISISIGYNNTILIQFISHIIVAEVEVQSDQSCVIVWCAVCVQTNVSKTNNGCILHIRANP